MEKHMLTKMYSIRDAKSETFHKPWHATTHGEAERNFKNLVNDPKSNNIHDFPEDFDLFFLGHYDDNTGKVEPLATPQHIVKAVQLKN